MEALGISVIAFSFLFPHGLCVPLWIMCRDFRFSSVFEVPSRRFFSTLAARCVPGYLDLSFVYLLMFLCH
jgi:hypothetical protein